MNVEGIADGIRRQFQRRTFGSQVAVPEFRFGSVDDVGVQFGYHAFHDGARAHDEQFVLDAAVGTVHHAAGHESCQVAVRRTVVLFVDEHHGGGAVYVGPREGIYDTDARECDCREGEPIPIEYDEIENIPQGDGFVFLLFPAVDNVFVILGHCKALV